MAQGLSKDRALMALDLTGLTGKIRPTQLIDSKNSEHLYNV